jgi:hypothetical protein
LIACFFFNNAWYACKEIDIRNVTRDIEGSINFCNRLSKYLELKTQAWQEETQTLELIKKMKNKSKKAKGQSKDTIKFEL